MTIRLALVTAATVAAAVAVSAGAALACGGGPVKNLAAGPDVKSALVDAYVTAHARLHLRADDVVRIPGRTYYGTFGGDWYAVAVFATRAGVQQPTILMHHPGRKWHVIRQTHGGVCGRWVPDPLIALWHLERWHRTGCFVEPA